MADFYYYLNRQGVRGLQGVKGDKGDSPVITLVSDTPNEYILKITNPDGTELITPNLRGNNININEGTYVRYNTKTGELYTDVGDSATETNIGMVRLATDEDIANFSETTALTPSGLGDALSTYLTSPDESVGIKLNEETSQVELTAKGGVTPENMMTTDTRQDVAGYKLFKKGLAVYSDDNPYGASFIDSAPATFYTDSNNFTTLRSIDGVLTANTGNQQEGNDLFIIADSKKGSAEITTDSIVLTDRVNDVTRNVLTDKDVDGQTIQVVDGKLHANTDELGNEVNDLSGRVTANEADITTLQTEMTDVTGNVETLQTNALTFNNVATYDDTSLYYGIYKPQYSTKLQTVQPIFNKIGDGLKIDDLYFATPAAYTTDLTQDNDTNALTDNNNFFKSQASDGSLYCTFRVAAGTLNSFEVIYKLPHSSYGIAEITTISDKYNIIDLNNIKYSFDGATYNNWKSGQSARYLKFTTNEVTFDSTQYLSFYIAIRFSSTGYNAYHLKPLRISDSLKSDITNLQTQVGDISTALDNINGEVI